MVDDRKRVTHTDVVVIGAGVGGLCCAAMLARYGYRVTVCEAHSIAGGVAHAFEVDGYHFDSGPSSHQGLTDPRTGNPLRQILDLVGEEVPCTRWERWMLGLPEGTFSATCDSDAYATEIGKFAGPGGERQWRNLERHLEAIAEPFFQMPAAALQRQDRAQLLMIGRYLKNLPAILKTGRDATSRFSTLVNRHVQDRFIRDLMDLEAFIISGLRADETLTGVMSFFWRDRNHSTVDYPHGGMQGLIDGLLRGITRHGGKVLLNAAVEQILVERGRATGVQLKRGGRVMASQAVVCNASVWDTPRLLPAGALSPEREQFLMDTPSTESFVHLHVGIDASDLPRELESHHVMLKHWDVRAEQNVVIISIPSLLDPSLAPPGKHCVHAYLAGNEPYEPWAGLKRSSDEYRALKQERSSRLWEALEEVIPDVRKRVELSMVGSPLTIERFCRRYRGTYGPALRAGKSTFPGPRSLGIEGLLHCGDSTQPGIGIPAAAASGFTAANTLVPAHKHWQVLDELDRLRTMGHGPRFTRFVPGEAITPIKPRLQPPVMQP